MKDLATGLDVEAVGDSEVSPVEYVVVDEPEFDIDEVNLQLQAAADEAREK
jgi:hypothetical protein